MLLFGNFWNGCGGIVSANGAAVSSDGTMVLKGCSGQWNWVKNQVQGDTAGAASHFNDQNTQIMSRVISEVKW